MLSQTTCINVANYKRVTKKVKSFFSVSGIRVPLYRSYVIIIPHLWCGVKFFFKKTDREFLLSFANTLSKGHHTVYNTVGCMLCQYFFEKMFQAMESSDSRFWARGSYLFSTPIRVKQLRKKVNTFFRMWKFYRNWIFLSTIFFNTGVKNAYSCVSGLNCY